MSTSNVALTRERPGATLAWEGSMSSVQVGAGVTEPGRQGLWLGILAYRWASYVWMTILALIAQANEDFARPGLAWTAIAITGLWTLWFSVTKGWERAPVRWIDLALAVAVAQRPDRNGLPRPRWRAVFLDQRGPEVGRRSQPDVAA
jgi:hypothetical protein